MAYVSALDPTGTKELIVADDGSIPATQIASRGLRPGAHLRVVALEEPRVGSPGLAGSLPHLPDLDWHSFDRASALARQDLAQPS